MAILFISFKESLAISGFALMHILDMNQTKEVFKLCFQVDGQRDGERWRLFGGMHPPHRPLNIIFTLTHFGQLAAHDSHFSNLDNGLRWLEEEILYIGECPPKQDAVMLRPPFLIWIISLSLFSPLLDCICNKYEFLRNLCNISPEWYVIPLVMFLPMNWNPHLSLEWQWYWCVTVRGVLLRDGYKRPKKKLDILKVFFIFFAQVLIRTLWFTPTAKYCIFTHTCKVKVWKNQEIAFSFGKAVKFHAPVCYVL